MNVHILSDSPRGTSAYASITRNFAQGLVDRGHNVTVTGFQTFFSPETYEGITVLPLLNPLEPHNPQVGQFAKNLKKSKADALICIHEAHSHFNVYSQMFYPAYFWVPVEGAGIPEHMKHDLKSSNIARVVSMSHAGQKELAAEGIDSTVIYPGWNPQVFTRNPKPYCKWSTGLHRQTQYPRILAKRNCWECKGQYKDKDEYKDKNKEGEGCENRHFEEERIMINYRGEEFSGNISSINKLKDNLGAEFVVGCVAQNTGVRKRLERLIEAFAVFNKEVRDSLLHIHTDPFSSRGIPLMDLINKFNIVDSVVFSYGEYTFGVSDYGINQLYNNFDINATASSAEGIGMTLLESEAAGKPQVAPSFGTFPELIGENERGLLASVATTQMTENGSFRCLVDVESLADKMQALYIDQNLRRKLGEAAAEWAKQYTWDKIISQWDKLLAEGEEKIRIARRAD